MEFLYIKAIHIIFVVAWFAALFYMVRLFIYTTEAQKKEQPAQQILTQQLLIMQKKLWYIIGWPAAIGTLVFGWWMYFLNFSYYVSQPWMWLKIIFVSMLFIYHLACHSIYSKQKQGVFKYSSFTLRLFNELATVLLVGIVFLVVVKSTGSLVWGLLGLFIFAGLLMLAVLTYKKRREKELVRQNKEKDQTESQNTTLP